MLSNRTRNEVRAPFGIDSIISRVEAAQKEYKELLPKKYLLYNILMDRFAAAMDRVRVGGIVPRTGNTSNILATQYREVTKPFERIDSYAGDGDDSGSYEETLRFLKTTKAGDTKTIMLSQSEFLALDRDDTAISNLRLSINNLGDLVEKTKAFSFEGEGIR